MEKLGEDILETAHQELKIHLRKLEMSRKRSCPRYIRLMRQILSDTLQRVNHMLEGDDQRYRFFMLLTVSNCLVFTKPNVFGPEHAEPLRRALDMAFSPDGDLGKIADVLMHAKLEVVPQSDEEDS